MPWEGVYLDPALQDLIRRALEGNLDLGIAAQRVLDARARLVEAGADLYPAVDAFAGGTKSRVPGDQDSTVWTVGGALSWELDFWGKYRRAAEAARAELLATEAGRRAVAQSVVAEVAAAYLTLRAFDLDLEISRETLVSREKSRELVRSRRRGGVSSELELHQAEVLVLTVAQRIPDLERAVERTENAISILLGENPGPVPRGAALTAQALPEEIPAGLPSDLLSRRPDLLAAEQSLAAACANVGEARAALLPTISLTAAGGVGSAELGRASEGSGPVWSVTAGIFQPIFDAGRLRAGVDAAEARFEAAALEYRRAALRAFREVADALVTLRKGREFLEFQRALVATLSDQSRLSRERYQGGVTSYLEVLDTERQSLDAESGLVVAERDVRLAFVDLYRALGGGWDASPSPDGTRAAAGAEPRPAEAPRRDRPR
jgi:multidrug efflux system outer membrane protein